jgi:hypothetical protein
MEEHNGTFLKRSGNVMGSICSSQARNEKAYQSENIIRRINGEKGMACNTNGEKRNTHRILVGKARR